MEQSCYIFIIQKTRIQNLNYTSLNKSSEEKNSKGYKKLIEQTPSDPSERFIVTVRTFLSFPVNKETTRPIVQKGRLFNGEAISTTSSTFTRFLKT